MDLAVIIGLLVAASIGLIVYQLYVQTTVNRRIVTARIAPTESGLAFSPGSALRDRQSRRFGFLGALPMSAESTERMRFQLARAGWHIRANEFLALRVVCGIAAPVLAVGALGQFGVDASEVRVLGSVVAAI